MIQLFDTHRLPYRNAKLRAWDLATKTARVNFQNYNSQDLEWTNIGTDVSTDESGYLFYGSGAHKVECLGVAEPAIVDVSLDGGQSYLIQFVIQADHDPSAVHIDDISGLTFKNSRGNNEVYNPVSGPKTLPDYLRRDEYHSGYWAEGTVLLDEDAAVTLTNWTHLILIPNGASHDTYVLTLQNPTGTSNKILRAGQVIVIRAQQAVTLQINGADHELAAAHTYLLHNNPATTNIMVYEI